MELSDFFPIWDKLTESERALLQRSAVSRTFPKGAAVHRGSSDCLGLVLVCSGQLRAYILSEDGREVTLYRLSDGELCLFSAACAMSKIRFDIFVDAEKQTRAWVIPAGAYKQLAEQSVAVSNYVNQILSERFSEVMWLIEQIMWKSFDTRLAAFLLAERELEQSDELTLTHEKIANHLGTAREVVTRMLRYFQSEGMVRLTRGKLVLIDPDRLTELAEK